MRRLARGHGRSPMRVRGARWEARRWVRGHAAAINGWTAAALRRAPLRAGRHDGEAATDLFQRRSIDQAVRRFVSSAYNGSRGLRWGLCEAAVGCRDVARARPREPT